MEREGCLAKKRERHALAGNRTRVSRVGGENSTTEPPMPSAVLVFDGSQGRAPRDTGERWRGNREVPEWASTIAFGRQS